MAQRLVSLPRSTVVALVGLLVALYAGYSTAAVTIYTGIYAGGTIAAGDAVLLNDGASVTGNVVANGTLQFDQTGTALPFNSKIHETGTLALTNTDTLNLIWLFCDFGVPFGPPLCSYSQAGSPSGEPPDPSHFYLATQSAATINQGHQHDALSEYPTQNGSRCGDPALTF